MTDSMEKLPSPSTIEHDISSGQNISSEQSVSFENFLETPGAPYLEDYYIEKQKFFEPGLYLVRAKNEDDKYGIVDQDGNFVLPPIYVQVSIFDSSSPPEEAYARLTALPEGGSLENSDTWRYGCLNTRGEIVIEPIYEYIDSISKGQIVAKLNGRYGTITKQGKTVIPFIYDKISSFKNEFAVVVLNGKEGYADITGEEVIAPQYDVAMQFNVVVNGREAYHVVFPIYKRIVTDPENMMETLLLLFQYQLIDLRGNPIYSSEIFLIEDKDGIGGRLPIPYERDLGFLIYDLTGLKRGTFDINGLYKYQFYDIELFQYTNEPLYNVVYWNEPMQYHYISLDSILKYVSNS